MKKTMVKVMGAALVAAGCGWTFAGELPESFRATSPQAVFSKRPESFSYESFAGKAVKGRVKFTIVKGEVVYEDK